jgi:hypothetical protein
MCALAVFCACLFFFRVYLSLSSLSLFTKIFLFKPQKSKTFLHHDEETVRERDKSVSDVMRMYAAKVGENSPEQRNLLSKQRAKGSDRHADRDERVFWKSHNAVQNNFTQ